MDALPPLTGNAQMPGYLFLFVHQLHKSWLQADDAQNAAEKEHRVVACLPQGGDSTHCEISTSRLWDWLVPPSAFSSSASSSSSLGKCLGP